MSNIDIHEKIKQFILRSCSAKEQSSSELLKKVIKKFPQEENIESLAILIIEKCIKSNIINDKRHCECLARRYLTTMSVNLSIKKIQQNSPLSECEIKEIIMSILLENGINYEYDSKQYNEKVLIKLFDSKFKSKTPIIDKEKNKQIRFFISKGFSYDEIKKMWQNQKNML